MSSQAVAFLSSIFFVLSALAADAFNINKMLSAYPDFTNFNNLLIQTGIAGEINKKHRVTVLVVANSNMAAVNGVSKDAMKEVLGVHVILDYYDEAKLKQLQTKQATILTTLYQESGRAKNQQGFLNMTNTGNTPVVFASAAPGSKLDCTLVKQITAQPPKVSVLQVSNIINIASISNSASYLPDASAPKLRKALAPAPSRAEAPAVSQISPTKPPSANANANANANAPAPAPASTSSVVSLPSRDYLASSILMIFSWAWLLLPMV
ncbi:hypothetical protein Golob_006280 [Gossypium lobatum]|uniref:FAS1 domain-containing protein n=1 Tax=Gossypium lobatum TaxID=34289 RepID=A0A7J8MW41_9ROSI|nr:hypothetical protein [Gossypium lobatum]